MTGEKGTSTGLWTGGREVLGMTAEGYGAESCARGVPGGRAGASARYAALFREGKTDQRHLRVDVAPVVRKVESECFEGTTVKFTQAVAPAPERSRAGDPAAAGERAALPVIGGSVATLETESVLIPMIGRKGSATHTLCVSSQVGCAMGCVFCQTAQMGLLRSLSAWEIVQQWFAARHGLGRPVSNVVFMGMGEPLDNFENVVRAIAVLTDHRGPALPMSKITVSTVGRIDGIERMIEQVRRPGWHRLGFAVSLNAPNDGVRSRLMPINRAMPMKDLRAALSRWPVHGGFKFCLEYVLIPGENDDPEHAAQLAGFVLGGGEFGGSAPLPALVNVIPYNPRDGSPWRAPEEPEVELFMSRIAECGVLAKRRRTKGRDTMAACGQLGNPAVRRRR